MQYKRLSLESSRFLSEMVHSVYIISSGNRDISYQAIPNGYIGLTLILEGHSAVEKLTDHSTKAWIVGLITRPLSVYQAANSTEITVVFNPVKLRSFIPIPMHHFANGNMIPAAEIMPRNELCELTDRLMEDRSEENVIAQIENFLSKIFDEHSYHLASSKVFQMIQNLQVSEVGDLSNYIGVSTTTLRNWSADYIGLTPKELIQIMRFQKVLNEKETQNLTDLAYRFQYYDQAHFSKTFKQLSGMTPSNYFSDKKLGFDFYKYGRWLNNSFDQK